MPWIRYSIDMNHHYPDNYHGGYVRGAAGMQGMGYGHGGYEDPSAMARMGHPRNSYPMPQYGDNGPMHSMMQHHQQHGMYSHGGYHMGPMGGGNHYGGMGVGYPGYNMPPGMNHSAGMSTTGPGMSMGMRGGHHMMGNYYNHPVNPHHSGQQQQQQQTTMANQQSSSSGGYNQSPNGPNPSMQQQTQHGGQNQMIGAPVNSQSPSQQQQQPQQQQTSHNPSTMPRNQGSVGTAAVTSAPSSHGQANNNNISYQSQQVSSPQSSMMMPGSHAQPRPVAGSMAGGTSHPIPQHPMRHPTTQQSPQEVADNILQIASSYPTNQTVQVPLKGRHAPYHIPRSPHYNPSSSSSSEMSHSSSAVNHFQQPSPASQPSPTPSTSSVKSPTPSLAPIPNPIPSPGIGGIKSPTASHCLSPCAGPQRSPSHMASSYSGHCQLAPSPQHYSPGGRGTPQQHLSAFAHSPPPQSSRNASMYPSPNDPASLPQSDSQSMHTNFSNTHQQSSSPQMGNMMTPNHSNMSNVQYNQQCNSNSPLMSLQKLVMLPEKQVIDPKSVVNDACLASSTSENNANSKNCEDPAERSVESSALSVGCSGQSSSFDGQSDNLSQWGQDSIATSVSGNEMIHDDMNESCKDINSLTATIQPQHPGGDDCSGSQENDSGSCTEYPALPIPLPAELSNLENDNQGAIQDEATTSHSELNCQLNSTRKEAVALPPSISEISFESKEETKGPDFSDDVTLPQLANSENSGVLKTEILTENVENQTEKETTENEDTGKIIMKDCVESLVTDIKCAKRDLETINDQVFAPENDEGSEDKSLKESENHEVLIDIRKEDSKSDLEQVLPESKSPGVLSEVQVIANGHDVAITEEEDADKEWEKNSLPKLRNGYSRIVRTKLGKAKKASQFLRLTTPCSISVGADEREVCEQFAYRRNGFCHTLRTSRLLNSGRSRQDSTGFGDSDESVENISDSSFHVLGNPQDGCKKKNIAKKSDTKLLSASPAKTNSREDATSKGGSNASSVSSSQVSNVSEKNDVSDEEMCYYEGVDSSDFIVNNNNSSDDSFSSSQEGNKQTDQATTTAAAPTDDIQENFLTSSPVLPTLKPGNDSKKQVVKQEHADVEEVSCPPAKRTRRSPGQSTKPKDTLISDTVANGAGSLNDSSLKKPSKDFHLSLKRDENLSERENDQVAKTRSHKRKPVLGKLPANGQTKQLAEVVVKLEKSELLENSTTLSKTDFIDLTDSPPREYAVKSEDPSILPDEDTDRKEVAESVFQGKNKDLQDIKSEAQDLIAQDSMRALPSKNISPVKKKKGVKRKQNKGSIPVQKGREEEVKDSFKSMKFSRTLDMMKSQRKKESSSLTGPFIRVTGDRLAPKSVTVCNQSLQNVATSSSKQNQKSSNKPTVSNSAAIRMLSNLPNNKTALVGSSKAIGLQGWWACAFCNHQSSFHSLGDVFGPYFKEEDLPTVERLASEETKKMKEASPAEKKGGGSSKKRKQPVKKESGPQEVWVHEACALWAPGVYLIGNKLYGMDEAIKDASDSICSACKEKGALTGCLHKGCAMKYHVSCAMDNGCCLDEENLFLLCPKHKDKKLHNFSASTSFVS